MAESKSRYKQLRSAILSKDEKLSPKTSWLCQFGSTLH
ncbi:unnamed protein product [Rhodiola kirilowii]